MKSKEEIIERINKIIDEIKNTTAFRDYHMETERKLTEKISVLIKEAEKLNEELKILSDI